MQKLGAVLLLIIVTISATVNPGEAGWKKRGWYMKQSGSECVMRKVSVMTANGKVVVQNIRVCK